MAYNERIKNFERIRAYMREFYLYGFKSRDEYTHKSTRSYDDEKRRMESILGDYMRFRQTSDGKNVFLSIDSRVSRQNPLYKVWKAKSFTDGDITLHFFLLDLLSLHPEGMELSTILTQIDGMLPENAKLSDESTVRKKLREYGEEGIIRIEKEGKKVRYFLEDAADVNSFCDVLDFFSEIAPCGVIGSFLLDQSAKHVSRFTFKHHYITGALDSEVVCALLEAMGEKRAVCLECLSPTDPEKRTPTRHTVIPIRLRFSVQNGRQYLMAYVPYYRKILSFRLDNICSVTPGDVCERFDGYRQQLDAMQAHMWGVSTQNRSADRMDHVCFTIRYDAQETHIPRRLEREKRCGTVEHLDANTSRFTADVYDASELIPWIRSFICRITEIRFSDPVLQKRFLDDIQTMYAQYGIGEGDEADAVQ